MGVHSPNSCQSIDTAGATNQRAVCLRLRLRQDWQQEQLRLVAQQLMERQASGAADPPPALRLPDAAVGLDRIEHDGGSLTLTAAEIAELRTAVGRVGGAAGWDKRKPTNPGHMLSENDLLRLAARVEPHNQGEDMEHAASKALPPATAPLTRSHASAPRARATGRPRGARRREPAPAPPP